MPKRGNVKLRRLAASLRATAMLVEDEEAWDNEKLRTEHGYLFGAKGSSKRFVDLFVTLGWDKESALHFMARMLGDLVNRSDFAD